ncbi:RNA polymerase sigma factor [Parabacteroides sp. OttesenSCG-928-G21]|nr:RNA polymerase sigma factor [Parabacteroides sp. OttesenSCG-928-G21]
MELHTDIYYIQRVKAGETACFACLIDRYSQQVYALVRKIVVSHEDAQELTQDVFMKVFKNLSSFKGDSSFSTWIYRIAYNAAISETRKKKYEYLAIEEAQINNVTEDDLSEITGGGNKSEQVGRLEKALTMLPSEERALILLFYMQEKSIDEIADISGLSPSNVKTKLFRIRKKLFILLNQMELEEI